MTNTVKFPMNGFEDTCLGTNTVPAHGTDEDMSVNYGQCASCWAETERATAHLFAAKVQPVQNCCKDHSHGSRYYDCFCCYGD